MNHEEKKAKVRGFFPELEMVKKQELADLACEIWVRFWDDSNWENIEEAAFSGNGGSLTLIVHTQNTVRGAVALAKILIEYQNEPLDMDLVILGSVLHDVSKLVEVCGWDANGKGIKSEVGKLYQHAFLGASKAVEMGMPHDVCQIILTHTEQSNIISNRLEAYIVTLADRASARAVTRKFF